MLREVPLLSGPELFWNVNENKLLMDELEIIVHVIK